MTDALGGSRRYLSIAAFACLLVPCGQTLAYESDVHYGLTMWLALKAGFAAHEAEAIAYGDQRVDSGGPQAIDAVLDYDCASPDPAAGLRVQQAHAPSSTKVPAPPSEREVVPGSDAAQLPIRRLLEEAKGKESLMLARFGAALHVYQDSWSHAGVPSVPYFAALECRPELALSHPASRGGWASHNADLTFAFANAALDMAKASYAELRAFPPVEGRSRVAEPWANLEEQVRMFIDARTKTQKKAWFVERQMSAVAFLGGISLPDGKETGFVGSTRDLLPELKSSTSNQYDAPQDLRHFFDSLMAAWILSDGDLDRSLSEFLSPSPRGKANELRARLKLLKMHDHGSAADLIHKPGSFSASDLRRAASLVGNRTAYVHPLSVAAALLPLVTKGANASPILPYITRELPRSAKALPRAIAIMRLRHAPYDSIGLIAERMNSGWKLVDIVVAVDH